MVMPNRDGSSRYAPTEYHTAEMELRSTQAGESTDANISPSPVLQLGRIQGLLRQYFPTGGESDFDELVHNRATILATQMHQTDDDVRNVINRARELDNLTTSMEGAANALGYALCAVPGTLIGEGISQAMGLEVGSKARVFVDGVAVGMTALTFKGFLEKMMENSLDDIKWMQANESKLDPLVIALARQRDTVKHKSTETALGGVGYDARNVLTGALAAGLQALPENAPGRQPATIMGRTLKTTNLVNQSVNTTLTLGSGTVSNHAQKAASKLYGEEFFFGRNDWQQCYELLASTPAKEQMREAGKARAGTLGDDLKKGERWLASLRNVVTISNIAEMVALSVGLGIANIGQNTVREAVLNMVLSRQFSGPEDLLKDALFRVAQEAAAQAANIPLAAVAYRAQGFAGQVTHALMGTGRNWRLPQPEEQGTVTELDDLPAPEEEEAIRAETPSVADDADVRTERGSVDLPVRRSRSDDRSSTQARPAEGAGSSVSSGSSSDTHRVWLEALAEQSQAFDAVRHEVSDEMMRIGIERVKDYFKNMIAAVDAGSGSNTVSSDEAGNRPAAVRVRQQAPYSGSSDAIDVRSRRSENAASDSGDADDEASGRNDRIPVRQQASFSGSSAEIDVRSRRTGNIIPNSDNSNDADDESSSDN